MATAVIIKAVICLSVTAFCSARQFPDFLDALTRLQVLDNTWGNIESLWSASYDQQWLQSIYSNSTLHQSLFSNVSYECKLDMSIWTSSLKRKEMWAIQMFDATGKLPPGVLKGNLQWLGNYRECINTKLIPGVNDTRHRISSHYCPVTIEFQPAASRQSVQLRWDLCIPQSCSSSDVRSIVDQGIKKISILPFNNSQLTASCIDEEQRIATSNLSTAAVAMICLLSVFGAVLVVATVYDVLTNGSLQHYNSALGSAVMEYTVNDRDSLITDQQTAVLGTADDIPLIFTSPTYVSKCQHLCGGIRKYLLAFSVRANGKRILSVDRAPADGSTLPALHGIRFISMSWVIMGHTWIFGGYVCSNPADLSDLVKHFTFQAILNAYLSVDTFFLLSGTLVSYLLLRQLRHRDGPMHINWLKVIVHRYWRLTPVYMILIGFLASLFIYFGDGPLWLYLDPSRYWYGACKDNWWTNLLYVNNFVHPSEQCFGWAWYLANDMQLFLFSLGFIVLLYKQAVIGVICATLPIIASCMTTGLITSIKNYPAVGPYAVNATFNQRQWMNDIYFTPWCRAGPYFVGVLLGFFLFRVSGRLKIHPVLVTLSWCVAAACNLSILYGLYDNFNGYVHLSNAVRSFYAAVHRTAWAVGVAWVIFACVTGNGGFVNSLLSWSAFVPLSRLTYAAYLVHPMLIFWYYFSLPSLIYVTGVTMTWLFCCHLLLSYALAFVVSLAFEAPMIGIMKLAFGERR